MQGSTFMGVHRIADTINDTYIDFMFLQTQDSQGWFSCFCGYITIDLNNQCY